MSARRIFARPARFAAIAPYVWMVLFFLVPFGFVLKISLSQTAMALPPYTPELNRMENVWEYLRGNKLSAGVWKNYAAIQQACKDAWNWLIADPDRIRSLGSCEWATVNV